MTTPLLAWFSRSSSTLSMSNISSSSAGVYLVRVSITRHWLHSLNSFRLCRRECGEGATRCECEEWRCGEEMAGWSKYTYNLNQPCTHRYTYIHADIAQTIVHAQTYTHTYIHTYTYTCIIYTHSYTYTCIIHTHSYTYTCIIHMHSYTYTCIIYTHSYTYTCIIHTHSYTYTCIIHTHSYTYT